MIIITSFNQAPYTERLALLGVHLDHGPLCAHLRPGGQQHQPQGDGAH